VIAANGAFACCWWRILGFEFCSQPRQLFRAFRTGVFAPRLLARKEWELVDFFSGPAAAALLH